MFVVHAGLLALNGVGVSDYFRKVWPVLTFAFSSRSSAATIPLNVETQVERLGVPTPVANLSATFGAEFTLQCMAQGRRLRAYGSTSLGTFYDGWRFDAGVGPQWNASRHLALSAVYSLNRVRFPGRDQGFDAHLVQLKAAFALDTRLFLNALEGITDTQAAERLDVLLDAGVAQEACPHNLAPTASTTAALALGDALAMALLEARGFTREDFALLHPAGQLGKRLLRVEQLMHAGDALPRVLTSTPMRDAI